MRWFPAPLSRRASDELLDSCQAALDRDGWGLWALEERSSGAFVGFTGIARPGFEAHFTPAVEVGWRLARSAWGRGLASEAARAAITHGFGELALEEIVSFTASANARSRAVMERVGMVRDPVDDFDHPLIDTGHPLRSHVLYRLARPSI